MKQFKIFKTLAGWIKLLASLFYIPVKSEFIQYTSLYLSNDRDSGLDEDFELRLEFG